ncbi:MAG: PQQ-binding-like beta-propeller repeat protein [Verrucomicrobiota bacterium]
MKSTVFLLFAIVLVACDSPQGSTGSEVNADPEQVVDMAGDAEAKGPVVEWPLFRGGPALTGVAEVAVAPPLKLDWTFETGDAVTGSPVVAEGLVFIGSMNGFFYALDLKTGEKKWEYAAEDDDGLEARIEGPACYVDGVVIVGTDLGLVVALDAKTGEENWRFMAEDKVSGGPTYFRNPEDEKVTVIVGSHDYYVYGLGLEDGEKLWEYETGYYVNGTPVVERGRIMFGGCDGMIHQVSAALGEVIASDEIGVYIGNNIVVENDIAYVAHHENEVVAFDLEQKEAIWHFGERDFEYVASPALTEDSVLAASLDKRLYRIDRENGTKKWEFRARKPISGSPVLSGEHVYVGSHDGRFYAVNFETGEEVWNYEIGEQIKSSPAVVDGRVIIGADDGVIYSFVKDE